MKALVLPVLFITQLSLNAFADESENAFYLPPPPAAGSRAFVEDFIELHQYQNSRTLAECAVAETQVKFNLRDGFGPDTGILTDEEVEQSELLAVRVEVEVVPVVTFYKFLYHRPRPYVTDPTLVPCVDLAGSYDWSYPSGHATVGYALSLALAKKYPERRDVILAQGLKIGENRLIGGVHHPSDVAAGRELAKQIMSIRLLTSDLYSQ